MSEETKNTAQEEETTDTPVTEETVENEPEVVENGEAETCLLYTSPSARDISGSRMPSSA